MFQKSNIRCIPNILAVFEGNLYRFLNLPHLYYLAFRNQTFKLAMFYIYIYIYIVHVYLNLGLNLYKLLPIYLCLLKDHILRHIYINIVYNNSLIIILTNISNGSGKSRFTNIGIGPVVFPIARCAKQLFVSDPVSKVKLSVKMGLL